MTYQTLLGIFQDSYKAIYQHHNEDTAFSVWRREKQKATSLKA